MPKYVLKIEAVFEADKPLSREARRKIVRGLRELYSGEGQLECDIRYSDSSLGSSKKPAPIISFEPLST